MSILRSDAGWILYWTNVRATKIQSSVAFSTSVQFTRRDAASIWSNLRRKANQLRQMCFKLDFIQKQTSFFLLGTIRLWLWQNCCSCQAHRVQIRIVAFLAADQAPMKIPAHPWEWNSTLKFVVCHLHLRFHMQWRKSHPLPSQRILNTHIRKSWNILHPRSRIGRTCSCNSQTLNDLFLLELHLHWGKIEWKSDIELAVWDRLNHLKQNNLTWPEFFPTSGLMTLWVDSSRVSFSLAGIMPKQWKNPHRNGSWNPPQRKALESTIEFSKATRWLSVLNCNELQFNLTTVGCDGCQFTLHQVFLWP